VRIDPPAGVKRRLQLIITHNIRPSAGRRLRFRRGDYQGSELRRASLVRKVLGHSEAPIGPHYDASTEQSNHSRGRKQHRLNSVVKIVKIDSHPPQKDGIYYAA